MSSHGDSVLIKLFENQRLTLRGWVPHPKTPWTLEQSSEICNPLDDFALPPGDEWCWDSNWRIERKPELTDKFGWEYASKLKRFKVKNRSIKTSKVWGDRARRRLWIRYMRRTENPRTQESQESKEAAFESLIPKVQSGLKDIYNNRIQIERMMTRKSTDTNSVRCTQDIIEVVNPVKQHIDEILEAFNEFENHLKSPTNTGILNKLRNDVIKEQNALLNLLTTDQSQNKPNTLQNEGIRHRYSLGTTNALRSSPKQSINRNSLPKPTFRPPASPKNIIKGNEINTLISSRKDENVQDVSNTIKTMTSMSSSSSSNISNTVRSGNASTFNPALLVSETNLRNRDNGHYITQSMESKFIDENLIEVDEVTLTQQLVDERATDIEEIHTSLIQVNQIFADISELVHNQSEKIDKIVENVDATHDTAQEGLQHLIRANQLHKGNNCIIS